jgi:AcrR family transcriptional regulator
MAQDTRERILEVAGELFTDHGYDATSLREIADRLGFTKAALYYHFQSKEQILLALLEPVQSLVAELLGRLEAAEGPEGWGDVLCWTIGLMASKMSVFRLLQRNRSAIEQLGGWQELMVDHLQMHERLELAVRGKTSSRREQVRMIAALGAVTGFDDWAPTLMEEIPMPELQAELTAAVRDILGLPAQVDAEPASTISAAG